MRQNNSLAHEKNMKKNECQLRISKGNEEKVQDITKKEHRLVSVQKIKYTTYHRRIDLNTL